MLMIEGMFGLNKGFGQANAANMKGVSLRI